MKILKIGTVSADGSKIMASASIHKSIRYDRAKELEQELSLEIAQLLAKAETEEKAKDNRGDGLDPEFERLTILREKMKNAQATFETRTRERAGSSKKSSSGRFASGMASRAGIKAVRSKNRTRNQGRRSIRISRIPTAELCARAEVPRVDRLPRRASRG